MTQASWQPPYMYVPVLGEFGVMNADGEWLDARESLFAEIILLYGIELGEEEYIQRGLAALRSSFVMMYCPENPEVKVLWEKKHPFFGPEDYGFTMENTATAEPRTPRRKEWASSRFMTGETVRPPKLGAESGTTSGSIFC